jgi:hypothetical protein
MKVSRISIWFLIIFVLCNQFKIIPSFASINQVDYGIGSTIDIHTQISMISYSSSINDNNVILINFSISYEIVNPSNSELTAYAPCTRNWNFYIDLKYSNNNGLTSEVTNEPGGCLTAIDKDILNPGFTNVTSDITLEFNKTDVQINEDPLAIPQGSYTFRVQSLYYAKIVDENIHPAHLEVDENNNISFIYSNYTSNLLRSDKTAQFDIYIPIITLLIILFIRKQRSQL